MLAKVIVKAKTTDDNEQTKKIDEILNRQFYSMENRTHFHVGTKLFLHYV